MATETFPTLTETPTPKPLIGGWSETVGQDPTIRTPFEGGYQQTMARFTRIPEQWTVVYPLLTRSDKELIKTFERDTVKIGAESFNWTNPDTNEIKEVRFAEPVTYEPFKTGENAIFDSGGVQRWRVTMVLEEV